MPWRPPRPTYVEPPLATDAALLGLSAPRAETAAGSGQATEATAQAEPSSLQAVAVVAPAPSGDTLPPSVRLEGFRHQWQTWNNCGPATITMATSHFGRTGTQAQAAAFLKPNPNDKNVNPDELVAYARSVGLAADWLVGGDVSRLKLLLANDVPVIVEFWLTPRPNDGLGHYRLLVGYDDASGRFTAFDSYVPPGANLSVPYADLDADWRVFNRTYIPVYAPEQAHIVARILGSDQNARAMWERALAVAQAEAMARPDDAFAWFNAGSALTVLGRSAEAVPAFDHARALRLPWRMLWYQFAPFEAYLAEGRLNDVLTLTAANLQQANDLEESHYYRGRALQAQGQTAAARAAYKAALRANPTYVPARDALAALG